MKCPICGSKTYIIESRPSDKYNPSIRRRRMCCKCKHRFTTYEVTNNTLQSGDKARDLLNRLVEYVKGEKDDD